MPIIQIKGMPLADMLRFAADLVAAADGPAGLGDLELMQLATSLYALTPAIAQAAEQVEQQLADRDIVRTSSHRLP